MLNGFFIVANFLAITVPCATVIMIVDHFALPRLFGVSRPLTRVPAWSEAGAINVPAFVACIAAITYGAWATHLFSFLGEDPNRYWGPAPLEAWLLAGTLYVVGVAICRAVAPAHMKGLLGFDSHSMTRDVSPNAVVDIASPELVAEPVPVASPARAL